MGLPEHTCISCAYLTELKGTTISHKHREFALDDKMWNSGFINYQRLVCHEGELESFESGIEITYIRNKKK